MRGTDRVILMCDNEIVNNHSDGGRGRWDNPIEILPPVGSVIEYMTFDEPSYKNGEGIVTQYLVKGYKFTTRETFNSSYRDRDVIIYVTKIEIE